MLKVLHLIFMKYMRIAPYCGVILLLSCVGFGRSMMASAVFHADPTRIFEPDSREYVDAARALLKTGRFSLSLEQPETPQLRRTPGYPVFIASVYALFGENNFAVLLAQISVSLLTCWCVFRIARLLWDARIALLSSALLSCDLASHINAQQMLSDTLFTSVLTLAILIGLLALRSTSRSSLVLGSVFGLLLSISSLIRPLAYYLFFPAIAILFWHWKQQCRWRHATVCLGVCCMTLAWGSLIWSWQLRNYRLCGSMEISHVTGSNLLFHCGASLLAQHEGMTLKHAQQLLGLNDYTARFPETRTWSVCQFDQRWKREGLQLIRQYPKEFVTRQLRGFLAIMLGIGEQTTLQFLGISETPAGPIKDIFTLSWRDYTTIWLLRHPVLVGGVFFNEFVLLASYLSVGVSAYTLVRTQRSAFQNLSYLLLWITLLGVITLTVFSGADGYSRFRIPLMPILCVYAAHGMSVIYSRIRLNHFAMKSSSA